MGKTNKFLKAVDDWLSHRSVRFKKGSMVVQTVIVSKGKGMTRSKAVAIAEGFGKAGKIDETGSSWRFRQKDPGLFDSKSFRTKKVNPSTTIVLGKLK